MLIPSSVLRKVSSSSPVMPTSVCMDLDATQSASYPGTGTTWANLVAAPPDGSAKTDWDQGFTSGSAPVFTGTAGSQAAYMAFSGTQFFTGLHTMPGFFNTAYFSSGGSAGWVAFTGNSPASSNDSWIDARNGTNNGLAFNMTGGGVNMRMQQSHGGSTTSLTNAGVTASTDFVYIISWPANGGTVNYWYNTRTKTTATLTFGTTTTSISASTLFIGQSSTGAARLANGTKLYSASAGNVQIDDADAGKIIDVYNARQGKTYA